MTERSSTIDTAEAIIQLIDRELIVAPDDPRGEHPGLRRAQVLITTLIVAVQLQSPKRRRRAKEPS